MLITRRSHRTTTSLGRTQASNGDDDGGLTPAVDGLSGQSQPVSEAITHAHPQTGRVAQAQGRIRSPP